jgi:hypothetical protein
MQMGMFMKVSGRMIRLTATGSISTLMGQNMKDSGKMINNREKVLKLGLIHLSMKEIIWMVRRMEKEF